MLWQSLFGKSKSKFKKFRVFITSFTCGPNLHIQLVKPRRIIFYSVLKKHLTKHVNFSDLEPKYNIQLSISCIVLTFHRSRVFGKNVLTLYDKKAYFKLPVIGGNLFTKFCCCHVIVIKSTLLMSRFHICIFLNCTIHSLRLCIMAK